MQAGCLSGIVDALQTTVVQSSKRGTYTTKIVIPCIKI